MLEPIFKSVSEVFKSNGFKKRGLYFYLNKEDNIGLVNIQKSVTNTSMKKSFTLNIGIYSAALSNFYSGLVLSHPILNDCSWQMRIGQMMAVKEDFWWEVDPGTDLERLSVEIKDIIIYKIVPALLQNISDKALINMWLSKDHSGAKSILGMYLKLSSLLYVYHDTRLNSVMEEFQQYCNKNRYQDIYSAQRERIAY